MRAAPALAGLALGLALGMTLAGCTSDSLRARPIETNQPAQVIVCRARPGSEYQNSEMVAAGGNGLGLRVLPERTGRESRVRVHPGGKRYVFVREEELDDPTSREIWVASLDGSLAEQRLTSDRTVDDEPCWTTDGGHIVFVSERGGSTALWRMAADGTGLVALFTGTSDDHEPDCAAGRLAFRRGAQIVLASETGAGVVAVTTGAMPALSPDGSQLAFCRNGLLFVQDLASQNARLLTDPAHIVGGGDRWPRFAPRGDRLLLLRDAPALGLGGERPWGIGLDGSNPLLVFPAERWVSAGFDALPSLPAMPTLGAPAAGELPDNGLTVRAGGRVLGRPQEMRVRDGHVFGVASAAFDGQQVAAVGAFAQLGEIPAQYTVSVTAAVSRGDGRLRIGIYDTVQQRYDIVVGIPTTVTALNTWQFTSSNLAYVDSGRRVWVEVIAEFGPGNSETLQVDHIGVTWQR